MSFNNKVVIVTGASSGIGAATAVEFAKEGANVVLVGRNQERLQISLQKCSEFGGKHLPVKADVTIKENLEKIVQETVKTYKKIDVLVNSAGIARYTSIADDKIFKVFNEIYDTNLRSIVYLTHLVAPYLIESKGNIVNIASESASMPLIMPDLGIYASAKAALVHFTQGVTTELGNKGVRVNAISPGFVKTNILKKPGTTNFFEEKYQFEPKEIADVILYLASDRASKINGVQLIVDNGHMAQSALLS